MRAQATQPAGEAAGARKGKGGEDGDEGGEEKRSKAADGGGAAPAPAKLAQILTAVRARPAVAARHALVLECIDLLLKVLRRRGRARP